MAYLHYGIHHGSHLVHRVDGATDLQRGKWREWGEREREREREGEMCVCSVHHAMYQQMRKGW